MDALGGVRSRRFVLWACSAALAYKSTIALMEYHCSDDKSVASRIFEKGLDIFGEEIEFVLRYLGFLISINDENSEHFSFLF